VKVCIIALDALEYTIVDQGDYPNLKQAEYGKVEVNVYPLRTPTIWASFLTGKQPKKHGVISMHKWNQRWIEWLMRRSIKLGLYKSLTGKGRGKVLEGLGLAHRRMYNKEDFEARGVSTIFDFVEKKVALSVPSYNEWPHEGKSRMKVVDAIGNPVKERVLVEERWENFYYKKEKTLKLLESDWELFMVHFFIADPIQHLWWHKEDYIAGLYEEMDKTVKEIKTKTPKNTFTLVISDHGSLKGHHTPYAFYSCNEPLNLKNPKITDFAEIILQKLRIPSKQSREDKK